MTANKNLGGRPEIYTDELAAKILSRLATGESMRTICKDNDMPSRATIFLWIAKQEGFSGQYAIAKEEAAEALAEEMFDIADNGDNDYMDSNGSDEGKAAYKAVGENIQRSKLRVDVRKWYLSKIKPKKYGEKITQEQIGANGGAIQHKWEVEFINPTPKEK